MVIDIDEAQVRTVDQVRQVLAGTHELQFRAAPDDEGRYGWIEAVLRRLGYRQLERADRGGIGLPGVIALFMHVWAVAFCKLSLVTETVCMLYTAC